MNGLAGVTGVAVNGRGMPAHWVAVAAEPCETVTLRTHRSNRVGLYLSARAARELRLKAGDRVAIAKLFDGEWTIVRHERGVKLTQRETGGALRATIGSICINGSDSCTAKILGGAVTWPADSLRLASQ